jgi:voltage-gated potassium channel Kch
VIKTALALTNSPNRRPEPYHIVGEIQDAGNLEAARLVGRSEAEWVLASDLISRITVQSCRQSGLSVVYTELLDFAGDELYFKEEPTLHGRTYFDAQLAFPKCSVIGMTRGGDVLVNPPADAVYEPGEQLLVLAEDDSTIRLGASGAVDHSAIVAPSTLTTRPERTLVLGYNSRLRTMLRELRQYVEPGSEVTVVAADGIPVPELEPIDGLRVDLQRGDTTSREVLERLRVHSYDHIIVLAYKDDLDADRADARTLVTLLHLRDIADRSGTDLAIVSEMLDDDNRELAEITKADDFIVSDKLISLTLAQTSENKQLTTVFATLFSSAGSEIYLRPAEAYIRPGAEADFYTVLEAARRRGETAIGYRIGAQSSSSEHGWGVRLNPHKEQVQRFEAGDRIIVLAEA